MKIKRRDDRNRMRQQWIVTGDMIVSDTKQGTVFIRESKYTEAVPTECTMYLVKDTTYGDTWVPSTHYEEVVDDQVDTD